MWLDGSMNCKSCLDSKLKRVPLIFLVSPRNQGRGTPVSPKDFGLGTTLESLVQPRLNKFLSEIG